MSQTETPAPAAAAPGLLFRGRYALIDEPAGKMQIPWVIGVCDRCADCGCGQQMESFQIPAPMAMLIRAKLEGEGVTKRQAVKAAASVRKR